MTPDKAYGSAEWFSDQFAELFTELGDELEDTRRDELIANCVTGFQMCIDKEVAFSQRRVANYEKLRRRFNYS